MRIVMLALMVLLGSSATWAQDIFAPPHYGSVSLDSGFIPDPHVVEVSVGGTREADRLGSDCEGFISDRPDFRLRFDSLGILPLYIWVESETDTTLAINGPDGEWYCDDDSGRGVNPYVKFGSPDSGTYDIWVGAFSRENNFEDAILRISELNTE